MALLTFFGGLLIGLYIAIGCGVWLANEASTAPFSPSPFNWGDRLRMILLWPLLLGKTL